MTEERENNDEARTDYRRARLRQQRNRLHLTREQFAELADIGAGYYGQIEVGTSRLSMEYILVGAKQAEPDPTSLQALLAGCSPRELRLAEKVLQLFLLRGYLKA